MAGFKLLDAYVEVTADGKAAAKQAGDDIAESPEAGKSGIGFGKKLAIGIGGALVAAGIGDQISQAMDIQKGQAKLAASLNLTKAQSAVAGKAAGEVYSNNYGDSMDDVQDAIGAVVGSIGGMKNANANAVGSMTKDLLNIRTAYGIDVADSAQAAGELMKNHMAKNGKEAADLLASGFSKVPPALRQDLLDAVNEYSPYFKQIGFNGTQMFSLLENASKGGAIQLDKAGDAVKEFGIRVTDTTDANAGPALKRLGLSQKQLADDMLAGGDKGKAAMQKIVTGLQDVKNPAEQARLTAALFGTQIEDIGKGKIPGFLAGLNQTAGANDKVSGSADKLDKTLNNTASNTIASVQRGLQGWTNDLVANSGVLGGFVGVAGTIGPQVIAAGSGITIMAGALGKMGIVSKIAAAGQWLLNAAMSANPIGIVIVVIAALVAALIWFFTQTKVGKDILSGFFTWLQGAVKILGIAWGVAWNAMVTLVKTVWTVIVAFVTAYINSVKSVITFAIAVVKTAWSLFWSTLKSVVTTVLTAIHSFIQGRIDAIRSVITTGIKIAQAAWSIAVNAISSVTKSIFSTIASFISGRIAAVVNVVSSIEGKIRSVFSGASTWLIDVGRAIIGGLATGIRNAVGVVTGAVSGVLNTVKSFLPHSPAQQGPFSGAGWTEVGTSGEAIVGEVASGFDKAAKKTTLAMPKLKTSTAVTGLGGSFASTTSSMTGDTIGAVHLNVNMDDVSDVAKLLAVMKALPQAARAGTATTMVGVG